MIDAVVQYFSGFWGQMELLATVVLILNVYLLAKEKLINYLFGAVGVILFGWIFLEFKLYSDMLLQWAFFLPLQVVGFVWWKWGAQIKDRFHYSGLTDANGQVPIVTMSPAGWGITAGVIATATFIQGSIMATTDASFPYLDAFTTWMSIVASVLMLNKYLENWILWITMDVFAIWIYYQKELLVTSGLYVIFLGLATYGLVTWFRKYKKEVIDEIYV